MSLLAPVAAKLDIDLIWFGVPLRVNMRTSFMHPPFGFARFYLRGIAPPSSVTDWLDKGSKLDSSQVDIRIDLPGIGGGLQASMRRAAPLPACPLGDPAQLRKNAEPRGPDCPLPKRGAKALISLHDKKDPALTRLGLFQRLMETNRGVRYRPMPRKRASSATAAS